jgi:acyl-CoA thioester hydrolase
MDVYSMKYTVRWADIDANRHVNYAAYVEAATELRYRYFIEHNLPPETFDQMEIGPVYTSMLINFYREVRMGETITINFLMTGLSETGIRWKIRHDFLKTNGKKAVTLSLEGTMINLNSRQPVYPTPEIMDAFQQAPRSPDFEVLPEVRWFGRKAVDA